MRDDPIRQALTRAQAYLAANPGEARYRDSRARAVLRSGLLVDVTGLGGEVVTTDMSTSVGGTASAGSPGWLFRAATASCVATVIAMRAAMLEISLTTLEVDVDSESDDRGILGIDPATPAGPLSVRIEVTIRATGSDPDQMHGLVDWGVAHCPVVDALGRSVPVDVGIDAASPEG